MEFPVNDLGGKVLGNQEAKQSSEGIALKNIRGVYWIEEVERLLLGRLEIRVTFQKVLLPIN